MLLAEHLTIRYGEKIAADDISFRAVDGQWWILAGPNGAGKTSLAGALIRSIPYSGKVYLDEVETKEYKQRDFAKKVGMLSQINDIIYDFSVREVVEMGRYAYRKGFFRSRDPEGGEKIDTAMKLTEITGLKDRQMASLSGGERQRVLLAQVIAQDPELLILDEPANHLDLPFQRQLCDTVREWLKAPGRTVITVMHDLTLARKYGTHALLMSGGRAVGCGPIRQVMTRENLKKAYGMDIYGWMKEMLNEWNMNETE